MTNTSWLSTILKWMFAVFAVATALAALALLVVWVVDPQLPVDAHFGPQEVDLLGQPGSVVFRNATFILTALHGSLQLRVDQATGLVETLKHYGLPVLIIKVAFFAALFELLRRLFRNVGRGESFTRQTVRLVQIIGLSLMVFSLVFAAAEAWFFQALYSYLAGHAVLTVSGTPLHLPLAHMTIGGDVVASGRHGSSLTFSSHGFPFGTPIFFSGLLVLALSEVFRQGLALKSENDLTV